MAYIITTQQAGLPAITSHNTPATIETIGSTTVTDTQIPLGTIIRAKDPTYGEGEFIRLIGVASTTVGSVVSYDIGYQTALAPIGTNIPRPIAVAMSACVAGEHGWYQISGRAIAVCASQSFSALQAVGVATIGFFAASATAVEVEGAILAVSVQASNTTMQVLINRPHMVGRDV